MATAGGRWWSVDATDRTLGRSNALNQLLLGFVVLLLVCITLLTDQAGNRQELLVGLAAVFALTGAAVALPWNRIPPMWSAALPLCDIVAIAVLDASSPMLGFPLLWVFPATWLASSFGVPGLLVGSGAVSAFSWVPIVINPGQAFSAIGVMLPLVIMAVATIAHLASRRANAQRALLDKQARLLARTVEIARRQEDTVTEILNSVDFGVIRVAANGTLSFTNATHEQLQQAALPRRREAGDTRRAVYAADGLTQIDLDEEPLARARRGEVFDSELVWYGAPGGPRKALSITSRRLRDPDGGELGGIVVSRDVTAEVTALRAREDLVASVSHELRTPLTSIVGYLELVIDGDDLSENSRRRLEVAERNATRLLTIVADILSASADARGGVELSMSPEIASLDDVVRSAIESHIPRAAERWMSIEHSGIEATSAYIDPHRVRQVLDNLISNAIKYGKDGGTVTVGVTSDVDHAWLVVRDDGPGIAADELPRLFERFYRSDSVRKTSTHGSGLGLAISRDIVRSHGGEITVQSVPGEGSTFIVRLPQRAPGKDK